MPEDIVCKMAVSVSSIGPADIGPADIGPADIEPADIGPADIGPADIGPAVLAVHVFICCDVSVTTAANCNKIFHCFVQIVKALDYLKKQHKVIHRGT